MVVSYRASAIYMRFFFFHYMPAFLFKLRSLSSSILRFLTLVGTLVGVKVYGAEF